MKYRISYTANEKGRLRDPPLSPLGEAAVGMAPDRIGPAVTHLGALDDIGPAPDESNLLV